MNNPGPVVVDNFILYMIHLLNPAPLFDFRTVELSTSFLHSFYMHFTLYQHYD
jgi:hypothetical protein